jgi:hypothetical protein
MASATTTQRIRDLALFNLAIDSKLRGCDLVKLGKVSGMQRNQLTEPAMTPRLAFIIIAATLAYLGLAILGWGGFAAFFAHLALIALGHPLRAFRRSALASE